MDDFTRRSILPALAVTSIALISEANAANVKISAFPNAMSNMGMGDSVTGLQGGVNVNFNSAQIIAGYGAASGLPTSDPAISGDIWKAGNVLVTSNSPRGRINVGPPTNYQPIYIIGLYNQVNGFHGGDAPALSNAIGGSIDLYAGKGNGNATGGIIEIKAGQGGANADGAISELWAGRGGGTSRIGGTLFLYGGPGYYDGMGGGGSGGNIFIMGGFGYGTGKVSGDAIISPGYANAGSTYGNIKLMNLPTTDPSVSNAIFSNNNVLMKSGVTNANGAYTIAGIGAKTITIVNGIITSIA